MSRPNKHENVELIIVDDLWAEFGSPLPDQLAQRKNENTSRVFKRWGVWSVAGLLTAVIHILVLSPLLLGSPGRKPRPPLTEGAAASQHNTNASEFVSTLIFVSDRSITDPDTNDESVYDVLSKEVDKALQHTTTFAELASVSQPEITGSEKSKDETAPTAEASGDDTGRALLFGMYMGQVKARIRTRLGSSCCAINREIPVQSGDRARRAWGCQRGHAATLQWNTRVASIFGSSNPTRITATRTAH